MALSDYFRRTVSAPSDLHLLDAEYRNLLSAAQTRITRMEQFRAENNLSRLPERQRWSVDPYDYGANSRRQGSTDEPKRHNFTFPFGKALTVKHTYRISGQLPDVIVDERLDTAEERYRSDMMEKIAWAIIRASGKTQIADVAWDASELGAGVFDLYFDETHQIPKFRRVDPLGFVEVQGVDNPHDFQRVYRAFDAPVTAVAAQYRDQVFRGAPVLVDRLAKHHVEGTTDMVRIVQMCDKGIVTRYACGANQGQVVGLYEFQHDYGFTPYIVIPNIGPYADVWGWGDYEFVRDLVHYIPALHSREADIIRTVANGALIERGTGQNPSEVKRTLATGGVLPSKREGTVEPIATPDVPAFQADHGDRTMEFLKMLGFAPDAAWGLPGSGSGTDRGLQLQPLLEYTAMKQSNWEAGLERMFEMAYRMIEGKMTRTATYRGSSVTAVGKNIPFLIQIGPDASPDTQETTGPDGMPMTTELPRDPKTLFDGDYCARFNWRNRVDPDDPQYVMSEMAKFTQGAQSLETTLENLGVQAPEDEMRRIEAEAERFPWVNQGLVSLLMAQLRGNAQGSGGGAPADQSGAVMGALDTMSGLGGGGQSGALNADAAGSAAGVGGVPYGAA
jgi:hypothetical protein